jgi:hypothetical protein
MARRVHLEIRPGQPIACAPWTFACDLRAARMSAAKCLVVLLPRVSDFVPDGLRAHPDVVHDPERLTAPGNRPCRREHSRRVVLTWHRRAADTAEPGLPVRARFLPRRDELPAADPSESVVRNDNHRDPVAPGGPATDRAVAHEYAREFRVDLEFDRAAIAFPCGHTKSPWCINRRSSRDGTDGKRTPNSDTGRWFAAKLDQLATIPPVRPLPGRRRSRLAEAGPATESRPGGSEAAISLEGL